MIRWPCHGVTMGPMVFAGSLLLDIENGQFSAMLDATGEHLVSVMLNGGKGGHIDRQTSWPYIGVTERISESQGSLVVDGMN